jgi:fructose-bisphosphate aldolase, class II
VTTTIENRTIRERTRRARALLGRARAERFAVGAFNADSLGTLRAVCRAARACAAPVLIELSHTEAKAIGLHNARAVLDNEVVDLGIEAYLNLDHAPTVAAATAAVDAGFELVHLDLFQSHPDATEADVVTATRELVEHARSTGALVEGEQQYLTGSSTVHHDEINPALIERTISTPDGARRFVDLTGIDIFAIGIGNVHGRYLTPKMLRLDVLVGVRDAIDVSISLHGGSGTSDDLYRAVARRGITKININSDIRYAYRTILEHELAVHPDEYATVKLMDPVLDAVQRVVEAKICAFGSAGKARPPSSRSDD